MWSITYLLVVFFLLDSTVSGKRAPYEKYKSGDNKNYDAAVRFLRKHDAKNLVMTHKEALALWNYESNLTEENKKNMLKFDLEMAKFRLESWKNATSFAWKDFKDRNETVYRWFRRMTLLGESALPEQRLKKLKQTIAGMQDVFSKAKVCRKNYPKDKPCDLSLEPELTEILSKSKDYDELKQLWNDYRAVTGKKVKSDFLEYVKLSNEGARLNGFRDHGEYWRNEYEVDTFGKDIEKLWKEVQPLYKQLHAFVRRKLIERYPDKGILPDGPIPAHLLGNMWAQDWQHIFSIVKPFPKKKSADVSKKMAQKKMKPLDMFKIAEEFYISLGLKHMTPEFWNRSIIEKPKDKEIVCHASASDLFDRNDFRIRMCTRMNMQDFITIHHEMGHIQYFQQYAHQPVIFRDGANPGFHEAVGDTLSLSVSTSKHLRKIRLLECEKDDNETVINSLTELALEKIAFLPYGYLVDSWRWKVFSGEFSKDLNTKWWEQRLKYQGLCPPVGRTEEDFDAACKYHVIADEPYISYFVSVIIQFQFHEALCDATGHVGPLHACDIYQNKEAGKILSDALRLGNSVHWTEVMSVMTREKSRKMDSQSLLKYFEPLTKWLKKQNECETIGWKSADPMMCPQKH